MDSGATDHITHDEEALVNIRRVQPGRYITFGNGKQAAVTATGEVFIVTKEVPTGFYLRDVLLVPAAEFNLISVPTMVSRGAQFWSKNDSSSIVFRDTVVGEAPRDQSGDQLYRLHPLNHPSAAVPGGHMPIMSPRSGASSGGQSLLRHAPGPP